MAVIEKTRDLFMRFGIRSVTMSDVSKELGISKKTLYQEVESKDDLVSKVMEFDMEEERKAMTEIAGICSDAIDQMVQTTIYLMKKMRQISPVTHYDLHKYYGALWKDIEGRQLDFIYEFLKKNIEWGQASGLYRENVDPEIISRFFVHKTSVAVDEVYFPLDTYRRDQLLMQLLSYHLNGITTPRGVKLWRRYKETLLTEHKKESI